MRASIRAVLYAILFGAAGFGLAQYYPLFSDPLTQNLCQPFSRCRDNAAQGYVIGGALLGMILGLLSAVLQTQAEQRQKGAPPT